MKYYKRCDDMVLKITSCDCACCIKYRNIMPKIIVNIDD